MHHQPLLLRQHPFTNMITDSLCHVITMPPPNISKQNAKRPNYYYTTSQYSICDIIAKNTSLASHE